MHRERSWSGGSLFDMLLRYPDEIVKWEIRYIHPEFGGEIWMTRTCLKDKSKQIVIEANGVN